ncbi:MAG: DoxX family protein [Saprospiraceae bacterium]
MSDQKNNKVINISLWVVQVLLGLIFIMAGATKGFQPIEAMAESMPWVTSVSEGLVRFIGISELLGGIGLLLPSILRIKPNLTVWAAIGLTVVMVLAALFHTSRGEFPAIGANAVFIALTVFVAWGRSKKAPILPKA